MSSILKKLERHGQRGTRLFHYTIAAHLPEIVTSGEIFLAAGGVTGAELPAVWFSFHPEWEETANKSYFSRAGERMMGTRATTMATGKGLARIEVPPSAAPHDWQHHKKVSGIGAAMAKGLERSAQVAGANPQNWRVSYVPVQADRWLAIETNRGNGWQSWNDGEPTEVANG